MHFEHIADSDNVRDLISQNSVTACGLLKTFCFLLLEINFTKSVVMPSLVSKQNQGLLSWKSMSSK